MLEAAVLRCSSKSVFLKVSQYSQENKCVGVRPATLQKRDYNTGVFLRTMQNVYGQLFYRTLSVAASILRYRKNLSFIR